MFKYSEPIKVIKQPVYINRTNDKPSTKRLKTPVRFRVGLYQRYAYQIGTFKVKRDYNGLREISTSTTYIFRECDYTTNTVVDALQELIKAFRGENIMHQSSNIELVGTVECLDSRDIEYIEI
jgi:hypothetical protein